MKAGKRQKLVYAALAAAVVWGAYNLFFTERYRPAGPPVEVEAPIDVPTAAPVVSVDESVLNRVAAAEWGHDPFAPTIKSSGEPTDIPRKDLKWLLSGIVYNERSPMAVINTKMVRIGDVIDDARVVAIERESVLLERDGRRFTLNVTKG